jgi:hypothetical protein
MKTKIEITEDLEEKIKNIMKVFVDESYEDVVRFAFISALYQVFKFRKKVDPHILLELTNITVSYE